ncbi:PepSY domain-containing protein [Aliikangiella maris]|uniref:PepSY domain-containing protein n=2 Tax=Aliikangiella maris TaxID=3162458 RepID=A0ABV2BQA0_9GAMM
MSRKLLISIHLYLAAFFSPVILVIAVSGGLYLLDIKGGTEKEVVYSQVDTQFDIKADNIESQVQQFFQRNTIDYEFDYIKGGGNRYFTRPTSKPFYVFEQQGDQLEVTRHTPDFVYHIIELHKGHGPSLFRNYQKLVALGLVFILLTGFYLGISSPMLKQKTWVISAVGLITMIALAS